MDARTFSEVRETQDQLTFKLVTLGADVREMEDYRQIMQELESKWNTMRSLQLECGDIRDKNNKKRHEELAKELFTIESQFDALLKQIGERGMVINMTAFQNRQVKYQELDEAIRGYETEALNHLLEFRDALKKAQDEKAKLSTFYHNARYIGSKLGVSDAEKEMRQVNLPWNVEWSPDFSDSLRRWLERFKVKVCNNILPALGEDVWTWFAR
jgi:hypothetical protein